MRELRLAFAHLWFGIRFRRMFAVRAFFLCLRMAYRQIRGRIRGLVEIQWYHPHWLPTGALFIESRFFKFILYMPRVWAWKLSVRYYRNKEIHTIAINTPIARLSLFNGRRITHRR
jgi:hypothetical protein